MPKPIPIESDEPRLMPYSAESERAILGAILLDEKAFLIASELLEADDFYLEAHRTVYQRMLDLRRDGRGIDPFTLLAEIRRHDEVEKIGGVGYLSNLTDGLPRGMNTEHYARNVREKATLRECIQECHAATQAAYQGEHAASEILDGLQSKLIRLSVRESKGGFKPMADICAEGYRELELQAELGTGVHGLSTGFIEFDSYTCGLQKGDLVIIAARPSQGKTALCLNIATHAAIQNGLSVGILSLEMSETQLYRRMVCARASIDSFRINQNRAIADGGIERDRAPLTSLDWRRIAEASGDLAANKIYIDDTGFGTITQISAKAQRLSDRIRAEGGGGLDLLIVDYLQLAAGSTRRQENRNQEITEISRGLKGLARTLNCPVIAASQLSRAVETRTNHQPQLSDLRDSGSIEQDADIVAFIYRAEYYAQLPENAGLAEIIIAKQRNGPTGSFTLSWLKQFTRFENFSARAQ